MHVPWGRWGGGGGWDPRPGLLALCPPDRCRCRRRLPPPGLETLCSQAYGSRNHALLGVILQRSLMFISLACLPLLLLYAFAEQASQIWVLPGF